MVVGQSNSIHKNVFCDNSRLKTLSNVSIPVYAPKLYAQIKGKLTQKNVSYLIISSTQMHREMNILDI